MYQSTQTINREMWSQFVANHPRGNIFQSPEMFEVLEATKNNKPIIFAAVDETGKPGGILMSVLQNELTGALGGLTSRAIVRGGPLVADNNPEILDILIRDYHSFIKRRAIYTQYRNFWPQEAEKSIFEKNEFIFEDHLNILVDLTRSEEDLWKDVHSKRRNEIRRAMKEGTTVRELKTPEEFEISYSILKEVYTRAQLPLHDQSMFLAAANILHPKGMIKFFGAVNDGKIIGTMVVLCYRSTIYDWYAGSYSEYYNKYPNDLLPWEVFLWGKQNGYTRFDFGGAGKPGVPYGVRDYKKKFGGELVNHGRYERVHQKLLMNFAETGLKCYQFLKGVDKKK